MYPGAEIRVQEGRAPVGEAIIAWARGATVGERRWLQASWAYAAEGRSGEGPGLAAVAAGGFIASSIVLEEGGLR